MKSDTSQIRDGMIGTLLLHHQSKLTTAQIDFLTSIKGLINLTDEQKAELVNIFDVLRWEFPYQ